MIAWLLVGLAGWLGINVAFLALALLGTSKSDFAQRGQSFVMVFLGGLVLRGPSLFCVN